MTEKDFEEYERRCEELRKENEEHLALFERCLKDKGLRRRLPKMRRRLLQMRMTQWMKR